MVSFAADASFAARVIPLSYSKRRRGDDDSSLAGEPFDVGERVTSRAEASVGSGGEDGSANEGRGPDEIDPIRRASRVRPQALEETIAAMSGRWTGGWGDRIPAALDAGDPLITSFLGQTDRLTKADEDRRTCLLFFLDADKSTKLMAVLDVLDEGGKGEVDNGGGEGGSSKFVHDQRY
ncbi:hypothetical protein ACHAWF_000683 [Thalassiosira exigua]